MYIYFSLFVFGKNDPGWWYGKLSLGYISLAVILSLVFFGWKRDSSDA
jgi:hypothetical protein